MLELVQRLQSPFPGGTLYVFNNNGRIDLVATDAYAEITAIQLWMANGLEPTEAGEWIAREAIVEDIQTQHSSMINQDVRAVQGMNPCIQNALAARKAGRQITS